MNEQFYELSEEKQLRIINAALEVFAKNDYKHAVTDEIARKAEISKGSLFYYFHNKKSLYLFLVQYSADLIISHVMDKHFKEITDYFELIEYAAEKKMKLLEKTPYLADFVLRFFYSDQSDLAGEMNETLLSLNAGAFENYFNHIDYSKFREGVTPREIYQMLTWMTDGYIHERQRAGLPFEMKEIMKEFTLWEHRLKAIAYKKEYQEAQEK